MYRSRSVDLSFVSREKYLSSWSRENTPVDCTDTYARNIRRSFTPVREISAFETVRNLRRSQSLDAYRTPIGVVTRPYHTNVNYYAENQPVRKYDVFQVRTWSYPIYKYIHGRDEHYTRPYSYTRTFATKSLYTPSTMTPEMTNLTNRRSYSGYNYVAGEHSFNVSSRPWSLSNYRYLRSPHVSSAPWYWYGRSGLRHYNSYRPPPFTSKLSSYWAPYY